jgi:hypothetical protein
MFCLKRNADPEGGQRANARSLLGSSRPNHALAELGHFVNRAIDSLRAYHSVNDCGNWDKNRAGSQELTV